MNKKFLEVDEKQRQLEREVQFERCTKFLVRVIEKYGDEVWGEIWKEKDSIIDYKW